MPDNPKKLHENTKKKTPDYPKKLLDDPKRMTENPKKLPNNLKKSRIRETKHLSTNADSSTVAIGGWTKNINVHIRT